MKLNLEIRIQVGFFVLFYSCVTSNMLSASPTVFEQVLYFRTLVMLYPSVFFWLVKPGNITECTLDSPELQAVILLYNQFLTFKLQQQLL